MRFKLVDARVKLFGVLWANFLAGFQLGFQEQTLLWSTLYLIHNFFLLRQNKTAIVNYFSRIKKKGSCFQLSAQYAKIEVQVFLTARMGRLPDQTPPEKLRHITLFLGNSLLDIFLRRLSATFLPLLCQKCGRKSAELGAALRSFRDC